MRLSDSPDISPQESWEKNSNQYKGLSGNTWYVIFLQDMKLESCDDLEKQLGPASKFIISAIMLCNYQWKYFQK